MSSKIKKVTLEDVAEMAGVSITTVHRALNEKSEISDETSQAIRQIAAELGYGERKSIRTGKFPSTSGTGVVGMVLKNSPLELLKTPLNSFFLSCMETLLAEQGWLTAIVQLQEANGIPRTLSPERLDAAVFWGMDHCGNLDCLGQMNIVHVFTPFHAVNPTVEVVTTDYWARGVMAADYLAGRGHKRIAYLNLQKLHPSLNVVASSLLDRARQLGIEARVLDSDLEIDIQSVMKRHADSKEVVDDVLGKFLAMPASQRPTGIHVGNDQMVVEVYDGLRKQGIRPMVDVDIISSDNEAQYLSTLFPRPATFDLHVEQIAAQVVEKLVARIENPRVLKGVRTLIAPTIIEGDR